MLGRALERLAVVAPVLLLLTALPLASAQERPPTAAQSGTQVLGIAGTPSAIFHQFVFRLATSDVVIIKFSDAPSDAKTVFTFHLHPPSGGIVEYLNVTATNYSAPFTVQTDGIYAPQWVNHNAFAVNLTYAILVYSNSSGFGLPSLPLTLLLLVGGLGAGVAALEGFLWWRKRREGRKA